MKDKEYERIDKSLTESCTSQCPQQCQCCYR